MNRVIGVVPVKTLIIVVVGVGVLALAGYAAQAALTTESEFGPAVVAPGADENMAASGEKAATALDTSGLERELKEFVQGQISAEANEATPPTMATSGLERDLKQIIWQHQGVEQANEETAPAGDTSGLERDLKDIVRDGVPGGPQAQ